MSDELKERIENLISYYDHHTIEAILKSKPGFLVDDFRHLLKALEKEL